MDRELDARTVDACAQVASERAIDWMRSGDSEAARSREAEARATARAIRCLRPAPAVEKPEGRKLERSHVRQLCYNCGGSIGPNDYVLYCEEFVWCGRCAEAQKKIRTLEPVAAPQPAPAAPEMENGADWTCCVCKRRFTDRGPGYASFDFKVLRCEKCQGAFDKELVAALSKPAAPASSKGEKPMSDEEIAARLERAYNESDSLVAKPADWLRVVAKARELLLGERKRFDDIEAECSRLNGARCRAEQERAALLAERNALAQENAELARIAGEALGTDPSHRTAKGCVEALTGYAGTLRDERDGLSGKLSTLHDNWMVARRALVDAQEKLARIADLARGDGRRT